MAGTAPVYAGPTTPGTTPLQIGAVSFWSQECPSELALGAGTHKVVEHDLVGGGRVTQSLGAQPNDVTFEGTFFDLDVASRVSTLRGYMVSGTEYLVTYGPELYYAIVRDFVPKYKHINRVDYSITLVITRDQNGAFSLPQPASLDAQVAALLGNAQIDVVSMATIDPDFGSEVNPLLATVQLNVNNASPIAQASQSQIAAITASVNAALAYVNPYVDALLPTDARFIAGQQLVSELGLIATNAQNGQNPQQVTVQGGSCAELAAQYYGDVSQAFALAAANGFSTPRISNTVVQNVVLPPLGGA